MKAFKTAHDDVWVWFWFLVALLALAGWQQSPTATPSAPSAPPGAVQSAPSGAPATPSTSQSAPAATPSAPTASATSAPPSAPSLQSSSPASASTSPQPSPAPAPPVPHISLHFHSFGGAALGTIDTVKSAIKDKAPAALSILRAQAQAPAAAPEPPLPVPYGSVYLGLPARSMGCLATNALPDRACTPGVVYANVSAQDVCAPGYSASKRLPAPAQVSAAYRAYGVGLHLPGQYQIDQLVPLSLGGTNDQANLWPESRAWPGYAQKDVVERDLHRAVCLGQMPLAVAQERIAAFWKQTN